MRISKPLTAILLAVLSAGSATLLRADRAQGSFERTLSVTGPVELQVRTGSGSIVVRKGAAGSVRVLGRVTAQSWFGEDAGSRVREVEQNPPIRQTGNIVTIGSDVRKWENVGIAYDLTVPEDTQVSAHTGSGGEEIYDVRGPVEASTGSGGIQVENIGGRVDAKTGSGNIRVSRAGGAVTASTGSGGIELNTVNGDANAHTGSGNITVIGATGAVRARAGSGRVRVEKAQSDVEAQSASGGVSVDGSPKSARWNLQSGSGGVDVSLPRGTPFELDAHTGSGSISTTHELLVSGTFRRNELRGVAIRPDNHIYIRTASGSVRVD